MTKKMANSHVEVAEEEEEVSITDKNSGPSAMPRTRVATARPANTRRSLFLLLFCFGVAGCITNSMGEILQELGSGAERGQMRI